MARRPSLNILELQRIANERGVTLIISGKPKRRELFRGTCARHQPLLIHRYDAAHFTVKIAPIVTAIEMESPDFVMKALEIRFFWMRMAAILKMANNKKIIPKEISQFAQSYNIEYPSKSLAKFAIKRADLNLDAGYEQAVKQTFLEYQKMMEATQGYELSESQTSIELPAAPLPTETQSSL